MARTTRRAANRIVRSDASQQDGRPVAAGTPGGTTGQVLAKTSVADFDAAWVTLSYVAPSRQIISGAGLTGGGDLSADRTLAVGAGTGIIVNADDVALDTASTRNVDHAAVSVIAGAGLTGGGTIAADRTLNVGAGTGITVNADDVALDTASSRNVDHAGVSVIAGAGLTGGGTIAADRTLNIGAGVGITVNADDIAVNYGTTNITACVGNDARLSDARTPTAHDILSASHSDTLASAVVRGSIIVGNATPKWAALAIGGAARVLRSDGTDAAWSQVVLTTDVSGLLPYANMVNATAASILVGRGSAAAGGVLQEVTLGANLTMTGTVLSASGGANALLDGTNHTDTLAGAVARGDIIVGNATPKWARVAKGAAGSVLTGDGTDTSWQTAVVIATSVSVPAIITAAGALTITPHAASNLDIVLSTTGDFTVNTNAIYVDTSQGGGAGWVGIGTSTPAAPLDIVSSYASDNVICGMAYYSADATGPIWRVKKSRGTPGSPTIVAANDVVGRMAFQGYDGVGFINTCFIDSEVDGTPSAGHMPGRLTFSTNPNTGGCSEVMRLDQNGRMFVGATANVLTSFVLFNYSAAVSNGLVLNDTNSTASAVFARFAIGGTQIGNIQRNASTSAVQFNTTSDERLKTDLGLAKDLTVLKALRVHDFTWKADGTRDRGIFAQEAYKVQARGVSVGTDERNEAGVLVHPWAAEKAAYVPDLIVGWQQHEQRISKLERLWQNR